MFVRGGMNSLEPFLLILLKTLSGKYFSHKRYTLAVPKSDMTRG